MLSEINRLAKVVDFLRNNLNKDLPTQHLALFLAVAREPGISMPELCHQLGMPQGTLSRNVKLMSNHCDSNKKNGKSAGYGLLRSDQSPRNKYQRAVFLTAEGELLAKELSCLMVDESLLTEYPAEGTVALQSLGC